MAAASTEKSICTRLGNEINKNPQISLSDKSCVFAPWMQFNEGGAYMYDAKKPAGYVKLFNFFKSIYLEKFGNTDGTGNMYISRMPNVSPPIFMATVTQGSADCQDNLFAQSIGKRTFRYKKIANPTGDSSPCWIVSGLLGSVFKQPAYIEYGLDDPTSNNIFARITPWLGEHWGAACKITLDYKNTIYVSHRFCGRNHSLCASAGKVAVAVANKYAEYNKSINGLSNHDYYGDTFRFNVDEQIPSFVSKLKTRQLYEFPLFGYTGDANSGWDYSFGDPVQVFMININQHKYIGIIGYNGVGWRQGERILFAIFSKKLSSTNKLVPLASFAIDKKVKGIKKLTVINGKAAIPRAL